MDDMAEKDMTLISPCIPGPAWVIVIQGKGHSRGEPLPPISNSVGMEIERARGNFTINQSSASAPEQAKGSRQPNDKSLSFTELELLLGCDARSEGNPPPWDTCTLTAHNTNAIYKPPPKPLQAQAKHISNKQYVIKTIVT